MFLEVNTCCSHNCATVLSGECVAGGVRNYYKYLFHPRREGRSYYIYPGVFSKKSTSLLHISEKSSTFAPAKVLNNK